MRVMTYNVHSCIDMNKNNSIKKIAELLKHEKPSIVGLNEVENLSPRTLFKNQPKYLASVRDMVFFYGPTLKLGPVGFFGNAILSRYPIYKSENISLPGLREPRCCIKTQIRVPKGIITVFSTHLGLNRQERFKQIADLTRLVKKEVNPVILMGDFNCGTDQLAPLYEKLKDVGSIFGSKPTFPVNNPTDRIDYILISRELNCKNYWLPQTDASDHLPVIADLEMP